MNWSAIGADEWSIIKQVTGRFNGMTVIDKSQEMVAGWDFLLEYGDNIYTAEVKDDIMSAKTGNVAIEVHNTRQNKASGLSATESDWWFHRYRRGDSVYIGCFKVLDLKQFVVDNKPLRTITNAGDGNARILLYPIDLFRTAGRHIMVENNNYELVDAPPAPDYSQIDWNEDDEDDRVADGYKRCVSCGEVKLLDDFHHNKRSKDGHKTECKRCVSINNRQYAKEKQCRKLREQSGAPYAAQ